MTDTIYTPEQIQQILFPVFLQYPVKKAILFGSYAKGTAETKSDIDILVDSGLKDWLFSACWRMLSLLWKKKWICWMFRKSRRILKLTEKS